MLRKFAQRASRYSINLDDCVYKNEGFHLRGSGAIIYLGTIDLTKMVDKVGTPDVRSWASKYGNRVKSFLNYYYIGF